MAPAKLYRRRLARRRRHPQHPLSEQFVELSMYKIAMINATVYLLLMFYEAVFSNKISKALILNLGP